MLNWKNLRNLLFVGAVSLAMLTGCAETGESSGSKPDPSHTHTALAEWDRDAKEHWHLCECGEKLEVAAHELNDMQFCETCRSDIWDCGDGMYEVYTYDEAGQVLRSTSYDADGNIISESRHVYEYDENGNVLSSQYYEGDNLLQAEEFALTEDGETYLIKSTGYQADGSAFVNEYDPEGNVIAVYGYDTEGTVIYETHSEYAYTEDGGCYESKATEYDHKTGVKLVCEYNEYEDILTRVEYDFDGTVQYEESYEREYNEDGDMLWEKTYRDGKLTYEIVGYVTQSEDGMSWRYPEQTISYEEDGGKVVSKYGDNGEVETETYYNADGTVDRELTYRYELDDVGNWSHIKVYEGDRLVIDNEYAISEDFWSYKAKVTEYNEDGSKTVSEYDQFEELIRTTTYDADDNQSE